MGGVISTASDFVVKVFCSCLCLEVDHICHLDKNLDALENAMGILKAKRNDVLGRVKTDEDSGLQKFNEVELWLANVGTMEDKVNETRIACTRELQGLPLHEFCSKRLDTRFRYGRTVFSMLEDVEKLTDRKMIGDFIAVAGPSARDVADERPLEPVIGQDTILKRAWNHLKNDETKIVGIFGMGGVGKTTLLKQINNKFCVENDGVDIVIWVVVSKNASVHKILGDIGDQLRLTAEKEWNQKNEDQKAIEIHNILRRKKFVLMLDDIWEKVNLNVIGVPYPNRENGCKVAFTTRSRDVCGRMGVSDPMEVKCLDPEKAWDLFQKKVGESTLESHLDIPKLARKIAGKCRGLPLALSVIGETMASRSTIQEWRRALDVLTLYASEFSGMVEEILPILKYSYDSLKDAQVKSCFLYCSLFPEDSFLYKERLIDYWIGERFIDENGGRERALNQGYEILGTLVRACLLLEGVNDKSKVKMHDVVRDMALWIASELGKAKGRYIVQAGVGLHEIPKGVNWKNVRRMSLMVNDIQMISESHECPELTTLLLRRNKLLTISSEFFRCMPMLLVLDLSCNERLRELPEEIAGFVSLRYLDLSWTKIERLPVRFLKELKTMIHLNLEETEKLESLQGISNLSNLRTLKLIHSRVWLDMSLMKELQLLEHLEFISVSIFSSLAGEQLLYDSRVWRCTQEAHISGRQGESVRVINMPAMENLRTVFIRECKKMEEIKIEKRGGWNKSLSGPCLFSNLSRVTIARCDGLKDLTWLLFAPNLTNLDVRWSEKIEEIISEEKAASLLEKGTDIVLPFQKLEVLELQHLPELKSIYWNALPFQRLTRFSLLDCPKLRKLPLDSKSVDKVEDLQIRVIKGYKEEGIERFEWEDEATRQRFMEATRQRFLTRLRAFLGHEW